MHLIKPSWVVHPDESRQAQPPTTLYTLALHPDQTRLATGGLDTKIRVWSTAPILNEQDEQRDDMPKLLSTLTSHSGAVMCLRWQNSGAFLASGSDDNVVMIWSLEQGRGGKVWGSTESNVENWKAVRRLVAHGSDVSGVAWSADDAFLASVGLDGTVMVWSGQTFDLLRRLDGHMGFVKGVVFDPAGQFLATQGDDNSLKIWRTDSWTMYANVTEPFLNAPKTNITRPTWSPDGVHIVTPNSMNNDVFVAAVIERLSWRSNNSMVGHENIIEVAAFNPLIFLRDPKGGHEPQNFCTLLALCARSSISIWVTSQSQPLLVLEDVFDRDILDLSWSADGTQLYACSSEGHVAAVTFSMAELGTPVPQNVRDAFFASQYGVKPRAARPALSTQNSGSALNGDGVGTMNKPNVLMARKGPGAKRIVPRSTPLQTIQPQAQQQLQTVHALPPMSTTGQAMPGIGGHQSNGAYQPYVMQSQPAIASAFANAPTYNAPPPPNAGWGGAVAGGPAEPSHSQANVSRKRKAPGSLADNNGSYGHGNDAPIVIIDDGGPVPGYGSHPRLSTASYRALGNTLDGGARDAPIEVRVLRPAYVPRDREVTFAVTNQMNAQDERGLRVLAVPQVVTYGKVKLEDSSAKDTLEWRNFGEGERKGTTEVAVVTTEKTLWVDYLPQYVVCATGSPQFSAVSTEEGALVVYSPTGRRLLPTLVLDSPCSFLVAEGQYLMAITSYGTLSVWDTSKARAIFPPLSVSSLLSSSATSYAPHPTITTSSLLPNGAPLLALSSGTSHSYDSNLCAWTRVSETWWSRGSDFWEGRRGKTVAQNGGRGVVRAIEAGINEIVVDASKEESEDESDDEAEVQTQLLGQGGGRSAGGESAGAEEERGRSGSAGEGAATTGTGTDGDESRMDEDVAVDSARADPAVSSKGNNKERTISTGATGSQVQGPILPKDLKGKGWEYILEPRRKRKKRTVPLQGTEHEPLVDDAQRRTAISLAHLETRIKAAAALDSASEYRGFLLQYAKRLGELGLRSKAEELVRELIGPMYYRPGKDDEWSPTILGMNKRDLCQQVLSSFGKSSAMRGMVTEYQDMLKKMLA